MRSSSKQSKRRNMKPMRTYGVRIDSEMAAQAKDLGINLGELLRITLARIIMRHNGKCPECGQAVKLSK